MSRLAWTFPVLTLKVLCPEPPRPRQTGHLVTHAGEKHPTWPTNNAEALIRAANSSVSLALLGNPIKRTQ